VVGLQACGFRGSHKREKITFSIAIGVLCMDRDRQWRTGGAINAMCIEDKMH
jgi:hypothetical protein